MPSTRTGAEPSFSLRCQCRDCQRQNGAASVAAIRMPAARARVTQSPYPDGKACPIGAFA